MNDCLLEEKLYKEAPDLHQIVRDSIIALDLVLNRFREWFPDFTDHSTLHSMDVLFFCNKLIGSNIRFLCPQECYVLIMAAYLHDIGMGVPKEDFAEFRQRSPLSDHLAAHPDTPDPEMIRRFHHELSGFIIEKYAEFFEIPSEELVFSIKQVSRGHRKTDLYDEKEYPVLFVGDVTINTAYLAAIIRLADEIDVGAGRNSELLFDSGSVTKQVDIDAFGTHESILDVVVEKHRIVLYTKPKEERFSDLVEELRGKIQETLDYCRDVADKRSDIGISQKEVVILPA